MTYVFLVFAILWIAQFALSYYQMRQFHRHVSTLRKHGRCAVGMHGNRWRGRTYAIVAADAQQRVRAAELFTGWTVFARPRPLDGVVGRTLDDLVSERLPAHIPEHQQKALAHAAQFLLPKQVEEQTEALQVAS